MGVQPYFNKILGDGKILTFLTDGSTYEAIISTWKIGDIILDTIPLWPDKFDPSAYAGSQHEMIDGTSVMQIFEKDFSGEPITLEFDGEHSVLLADTVDTIKALSDTGAATTFYDGITTYNVVFDYTKKNPVSVEYIDGNKVLCKGTIYLIRTA